MPKRRDVGIEYGIIFTAVAIEVIPFVPLRPRMFREYSFVGKDGKIPVWDDDNKLDNGEKKLK